MIDTGATSSSVSLRSARWLGIKPGKPGVERIGDVMGWGENTAASWHATIQAFQVGRERIENVPFAVVDYETRLTDVILGTDFLRAYRVLFAMGQKKLYLSHVGGQPFSPQRTVEPWIEAEAQAGNTDAQLTLAGLYMTGRGAPKDAARAQAWLEQAAIAGEARALLYTGRRLATDGQFEAGARRLRAALDKMPGARGPALWLYIARVRAGQAELAQSELAASLPADAAELKALPLTGFYLGKSGAEEVVRALVPPGQDQDTACYVFRTMSEWYEAHGIGERPAAVTALGQRCDGPAPAAATGSAK